MNLSSFALKRNRRPISAYNVLTATFAVVVVLSAMMLISTVVIDPARGFLLAVIAALIPPYVRFWGKSGHSDERPECLLLTQSGHQPRDFAVMHNTAPIQ